MARIPQKFPHRRAFYSAQRQFALIIRAIRALSHETHRVTDASSGWSRKRRKCSGSFSLHLSFCGHRSLCSTCYRPCAPNARNSLASECLTLSPGSATRPQWWIQFSTRSSIRCFGKRSKRCSCVATKTNPSGDPYKLIAGNTANQKAPTILITPPPTKSKTSQQLWQPNTITHAIFLGTEKIIGKLFFLLCTEQLWCESRWCVIIKSFASFLAFSR